ncbi:TIR domain-containing protein [Streptomyces sp. NPDC048595]|uniref:TIR domain-containing protein n=1 Tax=Streptomyces sp. NPDC048595 TaxID=3365576 RepID=UPI003724055F
MPSTSTATRYAYDAFLSYSHGADAEVAPAVHRALSRLAKPWNRPRALRIFRDQASLEASPDLWATIEAKLSASRHLVLLASPQAARSRWVAREIAYWKQHRESATLLIVLTSGAIHWDHTARNFDRTRTTALPPEVFGWFEAEPLWVDLSWARREVELSLKHARFRQDIGTVAASLHGVSKDALDSEEARQHARTVGVRRGLTWGLVVFLVASLVFGAMAQTRGDEAERQRKEADGQRRVATVRALLAESKSRLADDPRTAVRLGLTAYSLRPTTETRAALVGVLQRTPYAGASRGPDDSGQFVRRLSDDAGVLATADKGTLKLWDVSRPGRRRLLHRLTPPPGDIEDIAFSRNGRTLFVAATKGHALWDLTRPGTPRPLPGLPGATGLDGGGFGDGDRMLATVRDGKGGSGRMDLWDVAGPGRPRRLGSVTGIYDAHDVAMSPDGKTVMSATGKITLDEADTGKLTIEHGSGMTVWDTSAPARPRRLGRQDAWEGALAFSPDGRTLISSHSRTAYVWRIRPSRVPQLLSRLRGHRGAVTDAGFGPDGKTAVTLDAQGSAVRWDLAHPDKPRSRGMLRDGDLRSGEDVAFTPDGRYIREVDSFDTVASWRTDSEPAPWQRARTAADPVAVAAVAVSPDGRTAATAGTRALVLWDITDPDRPRRLSTLRGFSDFMTDVAFSADGRYVAGGDRASRVILWDASNRRGPRKAATLRTRGPVTSLAFSPRSPLLVTSGNRPLFTGGIDGWATLWDLKGARPVETRSYTLKSNTNASAASFSPDGGLLALPGAGSGLFDMSDPNRPRHLKWDPVAVLQSSTAFSAKRKLLAVGESLHRVNGTSLSEHAVELPDAPDHGGRVAFHPDGDLLAEADDEGTAVLWDIGDLQHPHTAGELPLLDDSVDDVAFTPDGRRLLTGGGDGTLRLWDLGPLPTAAHDPKRLACQVAGGGLDRTQWLRHAPGLPYQDLCR